MFVHLSQSDVPLGTGQQSIILLVCSAFLWCWNLPAVACMHPRSSLCHLHHSVCYQQDLERAVPPFRFPMFPPQVLGYHEIARPDIMQDSFGWLGQSVLDLLRYLRENKGQISTVI